jgi:predicted nuclease of predicted toxin-antitoxin system
LKLYLDANLSPRIAAMLRARGIDAVSAHEVGHTQLDDRAQLRYATRSERVIVTCDIRDYAALTAETIASNESHAGIILVPSSVRTDECGTIVKGLARIVRQYPDGLADTVVYLTRSRI